MRNFSLISRGAGAGLILLALAGWVRADVKLPALFSDGMVLQQGKPLPVWGWAEDGEKVTVEFRGKKASTTARNGKWSLRLASQDAGGPDTLKVTGKNELELKDVLVGEVWVCSGQSNMEWPLRASENGREAIAQAEHPQIRLFTVPKLKADEAKEDAASKWVECKPSNMTNFSAVAYYFGRDLQKALGVPVGLIHTSWGGSPAEVWMRESYLAGNPGYKTNILGRYYEQAERVKEEQAKWDAENEKLKAEGKKPTRNRPNAGWKPAELYNGMITPLIPFAIKGAIWYQGESNAGRAHQYRELFPDMIKNWRQDWKQGEFTFLCVQLAPWDKNKKRSIEEITRETGESDWAELREAQLFATRKLPQVGMVVITDVGDKDDIHPAKKEPVGARLALAAQGIAYKKDIVHSGPVFKIMKIRGNKAFLTFDHIGSGLEVRDGETLKGFAIAGEDRKFVWANAAIEGSAVVVSSPEVAKPVAVRYGWADYPVVNLYNKEGLPATPFRTDNFPMITDPKTKRP